MALAWSFAAASGTSEAGDSPERGSADRNTAIEEVVVTGSRILRDPVNEPTAIMRIGAAGLALTGLTNLGDATSCDVPGSYCSSFTPQGRFVFGPNLAGGASVALNDGVLNDGGTNISGVRSGEPDFASPRGILASPQASSTETTPAGSTPT